MLTMIMMMMMIRHNKQINQSIQQRSPKEGHRVQGQNKIQIRNIDGIIEGSERNINSYN